MENKSIGKERKGMIFQLLKDEAISRKKMEIDVIKG